MAKLSVKDLRIGNYLTFDNEDIFEEIISINNTNWLETNYLEGELLEDFKPIPLTEKWLEDFGFSKNMYHN